jgi:heptaprenyl diphosphate synthase
MAMMITIALILSYIETLVPAIPIPGAKIGLPNIITLLALIALGFTDAFIILIIRATISSLLFSSVMSLAYSLAGGVLSLAVMWLIFRLFKDRVSIVAISIVGAIMHSVGQVFVAMLVLETFSIITMLPLLITISIIAGLIVGFSAKYTIKHFRTLIKAKGAA